MLADCLKPLGAAELVVRIMPGTDPIRRNEPDVSVGKTLATVYCQRALQFLAEEPPSERVSAGQVLGYGIVHEIGHLLLPSMPHSPAGVMRAVWSPEELRLMRSGYLHFPSEQAEAM